MAENELLKKINRELRVTSLENSEKSKSAKIKSEEDDKLKDSENELETEKENEETSESEEIDSEESSNKTLSDDEVEELNDLSDAASDETEDVVNDLEANVLSSDPRLLDKSQIGTNEIDNVADKSGVLNDVESDKTSAFIDPDSDSEISKGFKVVDTSLGVFTVLNSDDKHVLLLDSNKQKIQISLEDFNNLNPFEVRDERLSDVNDFKTAYELDLKEKEEAEKKAKENAENNFGSDENEEGFEEDESEGGFEDLDIGFGESVDKTKKHNNLNKKEQKNILSLIQKKLSDKQGVSETIRTDVRSKNRCVLAANKAKSSKEKDKSFNETKPKIKQRRNSFVMEGIVRKPKYRREATQPSAIYTAPTGQLSNKKDFDIDDVVTLKDGKFVLVKLEGKNKTAYLKLKSKQNSLSINELEFKLNNVSTFFESLERVSDDFLILEKEIIMKKLKKYESEEIEEIENELDIDDEDDVEEVEDEEDVDVEDVDVEEEEHDNELEEEETPDSIPFSTEINGVRYSGTLYRDDEGEEEEDLESEEGDEELSEDEEEEDEDLEDLDDDLILQGEEEIDELEFPEGLDESVIKANASIYGNKYKVSFIDVKKECVRKAKVEMRKSNIVEAWNALVRGAKSIKC